MNNLYAPKRWIFRSATEVARIPVGVCEIVTDESLIKTHQRYYESLLERPEGDREKQIAIENRWYPNDDRTVLIKIDAF